MAVLDTRTTFSGMPNLDNHPGILPVINHIYNQYGHKVSAQTDVRFISVHGKQSDVSDSSDSGLQVMQMPTNQSDETMVYETLPTTNAIDRVRFGGNVTGNVIIWGATVDGSGKFTEVTQTVNVTSTGTDISIPTPLARVFTATTDLGEDFVSTLFVYEDGVSFTDMIPDDNTKIHLLNRSYLEGTGEVNNSAEKAAFTTFDNCYFVFKSAGIGLLRASNNLFVDGEIQMAEWGKPFINKMPVSRGNAANIFQDDWPLLYAKPNTDIRLAAHVNNTSTAELVGMFEGFLLRIID